MVRWLTTNRDDLQAALPVSLVAVLGIVLVVGAMIHLGRAGTTSMSGGQAPVEIGRAAPAWSEVVLPCVEGWSLQPGSGCGPAVSPATWPGGQPLPAYHPFGGLVVDVGPEVGTTAVVLATTPFWASLLGGGLALLVLVPVVRDLASRRPFAPGNARRLAVVAAIGTVVWGATTVGPYLAADAAITPLEDHGLPPGWLVPEFRVAWWPLPVLVLLACLAAALRHAERADDVDGPVTAGVGSGG